MFKSTLSHLTCPVCSSHEAGSLLAEGKGEDIEFGSLICSSCEEAFPILAGVAILVPDVPGYLVEHVKGIAKLVRDEEIPERYQDAFLEAKSQIQSEHIEEDLEAERVTALYFMNHFLRAAHASRGLSSPEEAFWLPRSGEGSPVLDSLVRSYWDHGPFSVIRQWVAQGGSAARPASSTVAVELGCGVGGLSLELMPHVGRYLGVDSSFASIALARHLALGAAYRGDVRIPEDLLQGPVSRRVMLSAQDRWAGGADFIVGDIQEPPLVMERWDLALSLNTIDMLDDPASLPKVQNSLLKAGGLAIQSCPYIWYEEVAKHLREELPEGIGTSAEAVEWLYRREGMAIEKSEKHVPWLFFKHLRQMEVYSVHMIAARKSS